MKDNKQKIIIRVLFGLIFVVALFVSVRALTAKFNDRQNGAYRQFDAFYAQPAGTVDVLFAGSSRVHTNINPVGLWEDYGISSYCLGLNCQRLDTTYYALKEAFKYQNPGVVVVEVSQLPTFERLTSDPPNLNGMRFGINYLEAIAEECDFKMAMTAILEFPLYHGRYEKVDKDQYIADKYPEYPKSGKAGYKGAVEYYHITAFEDYTDEYKDENDQIFDERMDGCFDRIVELCRENNAELIFTFTPASCRIRYSGVDDYFDRHPELTFINMSDYYDEIGFDPSCDLIDEGHLNISGSMKVGRFFGKYLSEHYDLTDHRGDPAYVSWDENMEYHYQKVIDNGLDKINGFGTYFDTFPNDNYIVIVSLLDGYDSSYIGQTDALAHAMCNESVYEIGGTWVIDGSKIIYGALGYESDEKPALVTGYVKVGYKAEEAGDGAHGIVNDWHMDIGDRTLEIVDEDEGQAIYLDREDVSVYKDYGKTKCNRGIEVIVYDKLSEQLVDAVCFDPDNGWAATRGKKNQPD